MRLFLTRRTAAIARLAETIARTTNTVPDAIRVRCGLTVGSGQARYSSTFDDRPGTRTRAAVEEAIERKVGHPLTFTWQPSRDIVRWRRQRDDDVADAVPDEAPQPAATDAIADRVQEALAHQGKGAEVDVAITARDAHGPAEMVVRYPSSVRDDSDETRAAWQDIVNAKAPGRWRPTWDTQNNALTLQRRPDMPSRIVRPLSTGGRPTFLPIGVDEHSDPFGWDLDKSPHALVSGETGGGKTVVLSGLILEASVRGWDIVIVDGKGTALAGFRRWPGVVRYGLGEAVDMHEALVWVEDLMRDRYRKVRDEGADIGSYRKILVVLDEFTEFSLAVAKWWGEEGAMENGTEVDGPRGTRTVKSPLKQAPSLDAWSSIGRLGREGGVHIVVGIQQAAARIFGDTEKRDQLGFRLVVGPTTADAARMMFGRSDVGRDVPQDAKGRGTIVPVKNAAPVEVQAYWTPTPRPHGAMPDDPADAALLEAFRAASPAAPAPAPRAPAATVTGSKVSTGGGATIEASGLWLSRMADMVTEDDVIRHDGVIATVLDADYDPDDDTRTRMDVRLEDGTEEVWDLDCSDAVEVRA